LVQVNVWTAKKGSEIGIPEYPEPHSQPLFGS